MKRTLTFTAVFSALLAVRMMAATAEPLAGPWKHQDIGAVEVNGGAALAEGVFTLKGTLDTWGTNDGFHFAWQPMRGDGQIVARVLTVENTQNHAKAGVMIRESLAANARHVQACVTPVDGAQFLARVETGKATAAARTGLNKGKLPYWVKLIRAGNTFTGYESTDGTEWTRIGSTNIAMKADVFVGLTTSSHQKTNLCAATFDKALVLTP
jgi:regulation of enolase protein 1 (concanavalin A-like superfamily)